MRNLTLRHLRSLAAVAQHGKISAAADVLGLTGPAVTLQLKQMEDDAGMRLFERSAEGTRLTPAGEVMLRTAHAVHAELQALAEQLDALKDGKRGTIRLGAVSTAKYFVPRLIAGFKQKAPDIRIDLAIGNRQETINALKHRNIDMALMGRPPRDVDVNARVFGDHPLVIVARPDHRLAKMHDIPKEELVAEHFLLREKGSGTRTSLEMFFADVPSKFDALGTEMGSNETIKQAVMAGLGIAFISAHTIEQELDLGRLVILDVIGMPIRRQWFMISRRDRIVTPAMEAFSRFLFSEGARYLPVIGRTYPEAATVSKTFGAVV